MPTSHNHTISFAYVAIGSNLGDRRLYIDAALKEMNALPETKLVAKSSVIQTEPIGADLSSDKPFLNAIAKLSTRLEPTCLMQELLAIEKRHGRSRDGISKDRTLDLDLIIYDQLIFRSENLILPHPRISERLFVLEPLAEIAPDFIIPGIRLTVKELLKKARFSMGLTIESE